MFTYVVVYVMYSFLITHTRGSVIFLNYVSCLRKGVLWTGESSRCCRKDYLISVYVSNHPDRPEKKGTNIEKSKQRRRKRVMAGKNVNMSRDVVYVEK